MPLLSVIRRWRFLDGMPIQEVWNFIFPEWHIYEAIRSFRKAGMPECYARVSTRLCPANLSMR